MTKYFLLLILAFSLSSNAQEDCFPILGGTTERLSNDIYFLASEKLAGREPGTEGALLAGNYISEVFNKLNLASVTGNEYRQEFSITKEVLYNSKGNSLQYKKQSFKAPKDYFPLQYSSSAEVEGKTVYLNYGIRATDLEWNDYKGKKKKKLEGKIFVIDISSPDGMHPHSKYIAYHDLGDRIDLAIKKGAKAVVFVNLKEGASDPSPKFRSIKSKGIPVIFVQNKKLAKKLVKGKKVKINTELKENKIKTYNIVGFLDRGAEETVVIGAHYDHLGMGGQSSLYRGDPAVHFGADDNASGVAGLLELARNIVANEKEFTNYNYVFIAFSGEEMGLLGSAFYTKNIPDKVRNMAYMINLDMIGRMEDNLLAINGVGTSPIWEKFITEEACNQIRIKTSKSGVGPSDHTSFYYLELPVLHFFTGTHKDYHKPTDIAENINYKGEARLISFILRLVLNMETAGEIQFTPTVEESMEAPKFTVTLGVMPSYMFEGSGMKIDGVTEGKPASVAGLIAGDIVIQMGEVKVVDMMSYMKALSRFNKGDKVQLTYIRDGEKGKTEVQF